MIEEKVIERNQLIPTYKVSSTTLFLQFFSSKTLIFNNHTLEPRFEIFVSIRKIDFLGFCAYT